ncbi:uncharacterized protein [Branchiostoma lanceolatum]|uniref:uncharacterized protein n=1 Tax=Branchiostoma lanceolatum TaxID=7740 RepID=UPI0034567C90
MDGSAVVLLLCAVWTIPTSADGAASLSSLGLPLPDIPTGYVYKNGNPLAPVQIEMFGELVCPDFRATFPILKEVADWYGPDLLCLKIHLFPLPYHKYAFLTHQVLHIIEPYIGINGTFDYMDRVLTDLEKFSGEVMNRTEGQVYNELLSIVQTLGVTADQYWTGLDTGPPDHRARTEFKYACHRGVAATPTYFVNGIMVNPVPASEGGGFGLEQWKETLDPMLGTEEQRDQKEQLAADGFSYGTCPSRSSQAQVTCPGAADRTSSATTPSFVSITVLVLSAVFALHGPNV